MRERRQAAGWASSAAAECVSPCALLVVGARILYLFGPYEALFGPYNELLSELVGHTGFRWARASPSRPASSTSGAQTLLDSPLKQARSREQTTSLAVDFLRAQH